MTNTDKDRIRLAVWQGWQRQRISDTAVGWTPPKESKYRFRVYSRDQLPDPFTDANDDYAVLEWMRQFDLPTFNPADQKNMDAFDRWEGFVMSCPEDVCDYKIGDYARAALKVLDNGA